MTMRLLCRSISMCLLSLPMLAAAQSSPGFPGMKPSAGAPSGPSPFSGAASARPGAWGQTAPTAPAFPSLPASGGNAGGSTNVAPSASEGSLTPGHSLLDQPAVPAQLKLEGGKLSVTAANASLSQTLREISAATGMQIDGLSKDQRVFGVYGPAAPQEVLSALLDDSGYNVLMVGKLADGAPRQLLLSSRAAAGSATTNTARARSSSDEDDDDTPAAANEAPPPPPQQSGFTPPTAPLLPQGMPQPGQVRTPQQMLEELQQLHRAQDGAGTQQVAPVTPQN